MTTDQDDGGEDGVEDSNDEDGVEDSKDEDGAEDSEEEDDDRGGPSDNNGARTAEVTGGIPALL